MAQDFNFCLRVPAFEQQYENNFELKSNIASATKDKNLSNLNLFTGDKHYKTTSSVQDSIKKCENFNNVFQENIVLNQNELLDAKITDILEFSKENEK